MTYKLVCISLRHKKKKNAQKLPLLFPSYVFEMNNASLASALGNLQYSENQDEQEQ